MNSRDTDPDTDLVNLFERCSLGTEGARLLRQRPPKRDIESVVTAALGPADDTFAALFGHDDTAYAFCRYIKPRLRAFLMSQGASTLDVTRCVGATLHRAVEEWRTIRAPHTWCLQEAARLYALQPASPEVPVVDTDTAG
jgi:hypothetical protein